MKTMKKDSFEASQVLAWIRSTAQPARAVDDNLHRVCFPGSFMMLSFKSSGYDETGRRGVHEMMCSAEYNKISI